jgi:hypothetical protein
MFTLSRKLFGYKIAIRTYFSSHVKSAFIQNFDKYVNRLKIDETLTSKAHVESLLEEYQCLTENLNEIDKELKGNIETALKELLNEEKVVIAAQQGKK